MIDVIKIDNILERKPFLGPTAVMIGNFDGFHRGHAQLSNITIDSAKKLGTRSCVATFSPHPDYFFSRDTNVARDLLFTDAQKIRAFGEAGFDAVVIQKFDEDFCQQTPEAYFNEFMCHQINARAIVVGQNFRFGKARKGNVNFLKTHGAPREIEIHAIESLHLGEEVVSSTRIRKCLRNDGLVNMAGEMLGHPYLIEGTIKRGQQLGRKLGFPTANLHDIEQLVPRNGVYAGYLWVQDNEQNDPAPTVLKIDQRAMPAVINIGTRPSVSSADNLQCEAHILGPYPFVGELYDKAAGVYLTHRLREEKKFNGLDELKAAISADATEARKILQL